MRPLNLLQWVLADVKTRNEWLPTPFASRPDARRLTPKADEGRFEYSYLRLSPDGSYVTFRRADLVTGRSALFRADPDGRHPHRLTAYAFDAEVIDLSTARHGPTKDLLVFESFGRGDPDQTFADIATVPTTCTSVSDCTSKTVWLTDNAPTGRRNANPNWSPDGSSIVFTDRAGIDINDAEIWTMRYLGTHRQRISDSPDFDYRPTWGVRVVAPPAVRLTRRAGALAVTGARTLSAGGAGVGRS